MFPRCRKSNFTVKCLNIFVTRCGCIHIVRKWVKKNYASHLFSAECTIGMVWGLTPLKHYGKKALGQEGVNFNVCFV